MKYKVTGFVTTREFKPVIIDFEGSEIKHRQDAEIIQEKGREIMSRHLQEHMKNMGASISGIQCWKLNAMGNNWVRIDT